MRLQSKTFSTQLKVRNRFNTRTSLCVFFFFPEVKAPYYANFSLPVSSNNCLSLSCQRTLHKWENFFTSCSTFQNVRAKVCIEKWEVRTPRLAVRTKYPVFWRLGEVLHNELCEAASPESRIYIKK